MGAWGCSITANDTAADLKGEYLVAFCYNDVEAALKKIDRYVRNSWFDESDADEWPNYYYSLAYFMWQKGILTDVVKNEVLRMIDSGFGLGIWEESGQLKGRQKALQKFREQISSPQPPKKKITVNMYTEPIFETGDIVAFQLQTANKIYTGEYKNVSESDFRDADGKYVAVRKIYDSIGYMSCIEPAARDIWPIFQLYDKIFDTPPDFNNVVKLSSVKISSRHYEPNINVDGLFYCEGSLFYFKRRKYTVLGNDKSGIDALIKKYKLKEKAFHDTTVSFGINNKFYNPDEYLLSNIEAVSHD